MSATLAVHREINDMFLHRFGKVPDAWLYKYAYVVVRSKIDERKMPVRFAREVSLRTLLAAVRWNRRITGTLLYRLFPRLKKLS